MAIVTLFLFIIVLFLIYKFLYARPRNYPPGPRGYPFVGYGLSLPKCLHKGMEELSQQYGSIVGVYFGFQPIVIVTGYSTVKQILTNEVFDGRALRIPTAIPQSQKGKGITSTDGEVWKNQRRFTLRHLREFGFGTNNLEQIIQEEIQSFTEFLGEKNNSPISIEGLFHIPVTNTLWYTVAGVRYGHDDPRLQKLMKLSDNVVKAVSPGHLSDILPEWVSKTVPGITGFEERQKLFSSGMQFIQETIDSHKTTLDESSPRDFIDVYLTTMQNQGHHDYDMQHLIAICLDLLLAGSETTSTFLSFAVLAMILYPDAQKKVQQEIDEVIGRNRLPSVNTDKGKLVYCEATIMEIMRIYPTAVMVVPHRATTDFNINGYRIPKDALVMASIYSVHMDKEYWGDPEVFRPERFIDSNGKLRKDDHFIAFGVGKRACVGESLARRNGFLFFTSLLQSFDLKPLSGVQLPDPTQATSAITLHVPTFKFIATLRQ